MSIPRVSALLGRASHFAEEPNASPRAPPAAKVLALAEQLVLTLNSRRQTMAKPMSLDQERARDLRWPGTEEIHRQCCAGATLAPENLILKQAFDSLSAETVTFLRPIRRSVTALRPRTKRNRLYPPRFISSSRRACQRGVYTRRVPGTISIETTMHKRMASGTEGNQVALRIMSAPTAKLPVMDL